MFFRNLTRNLFQFAKLTNTNQRLYSSIQQYQCRNSELARRYFPIRTFSSVQTHDNDLGVFLQKEIQLEKQAQKYPNKLPSIPDFQVNFILFSVFCILCIL